MTTAGSAGDFEPFFERSLDLMAIAGLDGYFRVLNGAWHAVLGWEIDELLSDPFVSFVHPDDVESTLVAVSSLGGGDPVVAFENRYRCRDGSYRRLQWYSVPQGELIYAVARDITATREVEASLRRSERFLESVVDNIPDMVFVKDAADLRFVRINRAGEELLGYSRADLEGKSDSDFFPEEEAAFFIAKDREVLESGEVLDIPAERIDTRLRGRRVLHTKKIPIPGEDGSPAYLLGIAEDITERLQRDELLQKRQETLDAVFRSSPDEILVVSPDLLVEHISTAALGPDPTSGLDARGRNLLDAVHPDDRSRLSGALRQLFDRPDGAMSLRYRVRRPGEGWFPAEGRASVLRDAQRQVTGAVVIQRDITEIVAAQQVLERVHQGEVEHRLINELQRRALLPPPPTPGLEVAARYLPAQGELGMGGDWYQGVRLPGGRLGLVVGDVSGHGASAAGDMTQLCGIVTAFLRIGTPLGELLPAVYRATGPLDIMASVVVCELDPAARIVRFVSAGHPPLLLVTPEGVVTHLQGGRYPLVGLDTNAGPVGESPMPVGSTLIAYTDGLVERRYEQLDAGLRRLEKALASTAGLQVEERLDELVRQCTLGYAIDDDIAAVLLHAVAT